MLSTNTIGKRLKFCRMLLCMTSKQFFTKINLKLKQKTIKKRFTSTSYLRLEKYSILPLYISKEMLVDCVAKLLEDYFIFGTTNWLSDNQGYQPSLHSGDLDISSFTYDLYHSLSSLKDNNSKNNSCYKRHFIVENMSPLFLEWSYLISKEIKYNFFLLVNKTIILQTIDSFYIGAIVSFEAEKNVIMLDLITDNKQVKKVKEVSFQEIKYLGEILHIYNYPNDNIHFFLNENIDNVLYMKKISHSYNNIFDFIKSNIPLVAYQALWVIVETEQPLYFTSEEVNWEDYAFEHLDNNFITSTIRKKVQDKKNSTILWNDVFYSGTHSDFSLKKYNNLYNGVSTIIRISNKITLVVNIASTLEIDEHVFYTSFFANKVFLLNYLSGI